MRGCHVFKFMIFVAMTFILNSCNKYNSNQFEANSSAEFSSAAPDLNSVDLLIQKTGWKRPIILSGDDSYLEPQGYANTSISGSTIQDIVTNPSVTIRPDGNSCISCHGGANSLRPQWDARTLTRSQFCSMVPAFLVADKPPVLKQILTEWWEAGCPR